MIDTTASRRRFLQFTTGSITVVMAGCTRFSSDDDDGMDDSDDMESMNNDMDDDGMNDG